MENTLVSTSSYNDREDHELESLLHVNDLDPNLLLGQNRILSNIANEILSDSSAFEAEFSQTRTTPRDKKTKSCLVCGKKTEGHFYYGGQCCMSCRAFFWRSIRNEVYTSFECARSKSCKIDSRWAKSSSLSASRVLL